ncbi:hypothetical protein P154DRAFT_625615 [Amniculicola lignicola CBS 123094]|uniref:Uncharacterized protein n=1 Tax=Amniculicola lignicola CBS 123094 TaxID=1392246 RepID=A0A6A5W281_9PLEO|nr:hypothetical protein P154DRAFT_625615 [Amniculicola lignicola CBS 123094]
MPFCHICADGFDGHGNYCERHNTSYAVTKTYDTYDAYNPSKYETVEHYPMVKHRSSHQNYHKPTYKYNDYKHNDYNTYDNTLTYHASSSSNPIPVPLNTSNIVAATASTFRSLATDYTINSLSLSISPSGTKSILVTANKDRIQCPVCKEWFPDHQRLDMHHYEYPSGCEVHQTCFGREEELWHGTSCRHERCFVKGCSSVYRREGGWKRGVVEDHVREWHH